MESPKGYGLYIKRISSCLESEANRSLQARNLTHSQAHFLMELNRRENNTAPLKSLESCFDAAQSTIAGLAVRLEKKGLIESFSDPQDRRVKLVRLTTAGRAEVNACFREIAASEAHLVSGLTDCERTLLMNLLERLHETVKKQLPE